MTPVTTHRRQLRRVDARRRQAVARATAPATLFDAAPVDAEDATLAVPAAGSGETLDRIVVGGWERLANRAEIPCLLCGGTMEPACAAHSTPIGGRCRDCGTTLS